MSSDQRMTFSNSNEIPSHRAKTGRSTRALQELKSRESPGSSRHDASNVAVAEASGGLEEGLQNFKPRNKPTYQFPVRKIVLLKIFRKIVPGSPQQYGVCDTAGRLFAPFVVPQCSSPPWPPSDSRRASLPATDRPSVNRSTRRRLVAQPSGRR